MARKTMIWFQRALGLCLVLSGTFIIVTSMIPSSVDYDGCRKSGEARDELYSEALARNAVSLQDLYRAAGLADNMEPRQKMDALYQVVIQRFAHGLANHTLQTNPILRTGGVIFPTLLPIFNNEVLLRTSCEALCMQQASVLVDLARLSGIEARIVGLTGHVVMEAFYNNAWHMYDPDYEVVPLDRNGNIYDVDALSRSTDEIRRAYSRSFNDAGLEQMIGIISSRDDNFVISNWKLRRRLNLEKATYMFSQLVAFGAVLGGLFLVVRKQK